LNLKKINEPCWGTLKRDTHLLADINEIFNIAAFLDPHFKDLDPFIPVNVRADVKEIVKVRLLMFAKSTSTTEESYREDGNNDTLTTDDENVLSPA